MTVAPALAEVPQLRAQEVLALGRADVIRLWRELAAPADGVDGEFAGFLPVRGLKPEDAPGVAAQLDPTTTTGRWTGKALRCGREGIGRGYSVFWHADGTGQWFRRAAAFTTWRAPSLLHAGESLRYEHDDEALSGVVGELREVCRGLLVGVESAPTGTPRRALLGVYVLVGPVASWSEVAA